MEIKINGITGTSAATPIEPIRHGAGIPPERSAGGKPGAPPEPAPAEENAEVREAVGKLNELFLIFDKSVKFTVDGGSGDIRVKIIDNKSQEVLREYPPEKVVDILKRIRAAVGVLVDETA